MSQTITVARDFANELNKNYADAGLSEAGAMPSYLAPDLDKSNTFKN